ncbi:hypothetical protein [Nocardia lijiangensis]|uniref:hypothetical protein n=1 Tax=Nocardia lijiangensis TaxID=299618 RepID=UPI0008311C88|nr:hypothetical protein [Nocardia lijiangensis]
MATRSVPQPPFSPELLADLHADNVDPELGAQLWPAVRADSDAVRYMRSLDEMTTRIRALRTDERVMHPMPEEVSERLAAFVAELEFDEEPTERVTPIHRIGAAASTNGAAPGDDSADKSPTAPADKSPSAPSSSGEPTEKLATPVSLAERRGRRLRWLAAAAAALAVIAGTGIGVQMLRGDGVTPTAQPTPTNGPIGDDLTATAALAALGRNDVTGPLGSRTALTRCVAAAGMDRAVLGSMNMKYQGKDAVLILLTGPYQNKITALVVGPGCTTGDPQVKNVTDIG